MKKYLVPFLIYILIPFILNPFLEKTITYTIRTVITAVFLIYFYKQYQLRFKFSFTSILIGLLIFLLWITFAPVYPLGESMYIPAGIYSVVIKLAGFILVAPFIEELFVRDFLIRLVHGGDRWRSVRIGTFCVPSFLVTVLFFGFSHTLWLSGLIAGVVLNLWLYKTKRLDTCIQAHMAVNFILAVYVLHTGQWMLW